MSVIVTMNAIKKKIINLIIMLGLFTKKETLDYNKLTIEELTKFNNDANYRKKNYSNYSYDLHDANAELKRRVDSILKAEAAQLAKQAETKINAIDERDSRTIVKSDGKLKYKSGNTTRVDNVNGTLITAEDEMSQIIKNIHRDFNTSFERKIPEKVKESVTEIEDEGLFHNLNTMIPNSKSLIDYNKIKDEKYRIEKANIKREERLRVVEFFNEKYPGYKFITHDDAIKLCEKYGLVLGNSTDFKAEIPRENAIQFSQFIEKYKHPEALEIKYISEMTGREIPKATTYSSKEEYANSRTVHSGSFYEHVECKIAATYEDFNIKRPHRVQNHQIIYEDPLVLWPVVYLRELYYVIVTAWGDEAADPLVLNQIHN